MMHRLLLIFCLFLTALDTIAQTPLALEQMESIYQRELRERHIPLISKYLIEIQRGAAAATNKTPYQAEMARLQQILQAGGVIDLAAARASISSPVTGMPMPMPVPLPRIAEQAVITLSPAIAIATSTPLATAATFAPVGEIEWRIEFMAAGSYDIHLYYNCPTLTAPLPVRIDLGNATLETTLAPDQSTPDDKTYQVFRLGKITLLSDLRAKNLRFLAGDKSTTSVQLRHLFITPAKASP